MSRPAQIRDHVAEAVQRALHDYLGDHVSLPLEAKLLADLGLDSVALVVTIFDVSEQLAIDMADAELKEFSGIHTIEDLIDFFQTLCG